MKVLVRVVAVLVVLLAVGWGVYYAMMTGGFSGVEAAAEVGQKMPGFSLPDYTGEEHTLHDLKGKVVVLEFCSQKCPYSRGADSDLIALYKAHKDAGVVFLGIDSHRSTPPGEIKEYAGEIGKSYPILKDEGNKYADVVGAKVTPEVYVLDEEGTVRYHGAFDNRSNPEKKGDEAYVADAIQAVLAGEDVEPKRVKAWGCTIKRAD